MHSMNTHLHVLRVQSIELRSADSQIFKVVSKYCVMRWLGILVLTGITYRVVLIVFLNVNAIDQMKGVAEKITQQ